MTKPEVRQFYIPVPLDVATALMVACNREDRPGKYQCVKYVRDGLIRDGYLRPEPEPEPLPWHDANDDRPYRAVAPESVR